MDTTFTQSTTFNKRMIDITTIKPLSTKKNILWNSLGSTIYQGCLWLTTVFVVLLSNSYENSGILAFAMTVGNIFSPVAIYSIRTYQVSDIENTHSLPNYIAFRLITISAGFALCIPYSAFITPTENTLLAVLVFLVFKADESFASVCYGAEQKASRMDYIGISQSLRGITLLVSFCLALYFTGNLFIAIGAMTIACLPITLLYDLPHAKLFGKIAPKIELNRCFLLLKTCFPAVIAALLCGSVVAIARQCFGIQYGNEALGIYAAVATPSVVIQLFAQYLYSPFLTPIAEKWHSQNHDDFLAYFKRVGCGILLAIIVATLAFGFAGQPLIVLIYGASISEYTYLLPYVMISTALIAIMWFLGDVLVIFRDFKGVLIANATAFASTLLLMGYLIDHYYMNGINVVIIFSYIIGIVVGGAFLFCQIRRKG